MASLCSSRLLSSEHLREFFPTISAGCLAEMLTLCLLIGAQGRVSIFTHCVPPLSVASGLSPLRAMCAWLGLCAVVLTHKVLRWTLLTLEVLKRVKFRVVGEFLVCHAAVLCALDN